MDRPSLPASLVAATLFLGLAGSLWAQDSMAASEGGVSPQATQLIARYDRNHDGKLDDEEKANAKLANLTAGEVGSRKVAKAIKDRAQRFDADGDGHLNAAERANFERSLRAEIESHPKRLKRADTDHDGKLSDAEWLVVREALRKRVNAERSPAANDAP